MKTLITIALLTFTLLAQERVLLRIGENGQQEAIPFRPAEQTQDAIERLESIRSQRSQNPTITAGLVDTVRYFQTESELSTNFSFLHQDVAMQWYKSIADGEVLEFWWRNLTYGGNIRKGTVRAWYADPRLANVPQSPNTKFMGYYRDSSDGDGGVQPFKPDSGDQWHYCPGIQDPPQPCYDPFLSELPWLKGGVQLKLDSGAWQGIRLSDYGEPVNVKQNTCFAFTLSNDSKIPDIGAGVDVRMELATTPNIIGSPYHSYKFYERGRTAPSNAGWHMRGDYDWGFYVVMAYTVCRPPKLTWSPLLTTVSTKLRQLCINASGFSCSNPADSVFILKLHYKVGRNSLYDSTVSYGKDGTYCFELPGANPQDTIYYYASVQTAGSMTSTAVRSYTIFNPINKKLFIYNNATFSQKDAKLIYTGSYTAPGYDYWSTPNDGIGELNEVLSLYDNVFVADGNAPSRYIYPALKQWLATGTVNKPKRFLLTSQDYGCFMDTTCTDTTFTTGTWEYDFLGLEKIGPQNLLPAFRAHRILPQADTVTNYLVNFLKENKVKLWYDPTFELGFKGSMDVLQAREGAKVLLREGLENRPVGIKYQTGNTVTMFTALDIGALNLKTDSSTYCQTCDSIIYWWIINVGTLSNAFFNSLITGVEKGDDTQLLHYALNQNYPNPFNPSTTIEYSIVAKSNVTISVYNTIGQKVATIVNETKDPGSYRAEWNASHMASGLYFYKLQAGSFVDVKKMMYIK